MATVVAAGAVIAVAPAIASAEFKDVKKTAPYYNAVMDLVNRGVISGFADNTFKPDLHMSRGQAAIVIARMLNLSTTDTNGSYFTDITSGNQFYGAAASLVNAGVDVAYEDGSFKPRQNITRNEFAKMLVQAFDLVGTSKYLPFTDVDSMYRPYIQAVYDHKVMHGVSANSFKGDGYISRGNIVLAAWKAESVAKKEIELTIEDLSKSTVTTDDGSYKFVDGLKSLFNSSNTRALQDAVITAKVVNGVITDVTTLQLNNSGTDSTPIAFNGGHIKNMKKLEINGDYISLKNMTVNGDVTVGYYAGMSFAADNIKVNGRMIVEDGYSSSTSLSLQNTEVEQLVIERDSIVLNANKPIAKVRLAPSVYSVSLNAKMKRLDIAENSYVTIKGNASIEKTYLEMGADVDLQMNGRIQAFFVEHRDSTIYLSGNTSILSLTIPISGQVDDIVYYWWGNRYNIARIVYEGSSSNLNGFEKPVVPPVSEYDKAVQAAVTSFGASWDADGSLLSIVTNFGTFNKTELKNITVDTVLQATSGFAGIPDSTTYTVNLKNNNGEEIPATVTVGELKSGISLSTLSGLSAKELLQYTEKGKDQWDIEIQGLKTNVTLNVGLLFNGSAVRSSVVTITPSGAYSNALAEAIQSFTATGNDKKLVFKTKFGRIDGAVLQDATLDAKVKLKEGLVNTDGSKKYNFTILYNGSDVTGAGKAVTVQQLRDGVLLSDILGVSPAKLTDHRPDTTDTWTIEVPDLDEKATFDFDLLVDGIPVKNSSASVNDTTDGNYYAAVNAAIKGYTATGTNNVLTLTTQFGEINTTVLKDTIIKRKLKLLTNLPTNDEIEYKVELKRDGALIRDFTVTEKNLLNGIYFYEENPKITLFKRNSKDTITVTLTDINGQVVTEKAEFETALSVETENKNDVSSDVVSAFLNNTLANYKDPVVFTGVDSNELSLGFNHKVPEELMKKSSETVKDYNERILNTLFSFQLPGVKDSNNVERTDLTTADVEVALGTSNSSIDWSKVTVNVKDKQLTIKLNDNMVSAISNSLGQLRMTMHLMNAIENPSPNDYKKFKVLFEKHNPSTIKAKYVPLTNEAKYETEIKAFNLSTRNNELLVETEFGSIASSNTEGIDAQLTATSISEGGNYKVRVFYNGEEIVHPTSSEAIDLTAAELTGGVKLSEIIARITGTTATEAPLYGHQNRTDTWKFVIEPTKSESIAITAHLLVDGEQVRSRSTTVNVVKSSTN